MIEHFGHRRREHHKDPVKQFDTYVYIYIYTSVNPLLPVASNNGSDGLGPVEPLVVRGTSLEDYLSRILDGKKCVQPWCLVDC
jgi:hypothetical protein